MKTLRWLVLALTLVLPVIVFVPMVSAAPKAWTTTVTVDCDAADTIITGNFYTNYGAKNEKLLRLNGDRSYVFWGLTCTGAGTISQSWTTKWAPTDAVVGWTFGEQCAVTRAFSVPMSATSNSDLSEPPTNCSSFGTATVTIPAAVQN